MNKQRDILWALKKITPEREGFRDIILVDCRYTLFKGFKQVSAPVSDMKGNCFQSVQEDGSAIPRQENRVC